VSLRALRSTVERQYRSENDGERNPASIQQPPPPPPQKNIKNAILVEIAREIEEAINESFEPIMHWDIVKMQFFRLSQPIS